MGRKRTKSTTLALFLVLLLGMSGLGTVVSWASVRVAGPDGVAGRPTTSAPSPRHHPLPGTTPGKVPGATSTSPTRPAAPGTPPTTSPASPPTQRSTPTAAPSLTPGPRLSGPGDSGAKVRELQARLKQIGWYAPDVDGRYSTATTTSVRGFQAKRRIPVTGVVDARTVARLQAMTRTPTNDELHNISTSSAATGARLDPRCRTGRAMCIDKTSQTLRWVADGTVRATYAVRFGASYSPTREGLFHLQSKSADHVSHLYGSAMPYSMFFSGGQAVHYSSDFAARGYNGASHGCVNVRDYNGIRSLFGQVRVGEKVVVYRS